MKDRNYYIRRAKTGLRILVIYFCATRPRYEKSYFTNGKFDETKLRKDIDFLKKWDSMTQRQKDIHCGDYTKIASRYNYTFGIPCRLVESILGEDGDGKRIPESEVVNALVERGWLEVENAGARQEQDKDKVWHKKCWWKKKYLLKNPKTWLMYLRNPNYSGVEHYPLDKDGFVLRAIKLIKKWREKTMGKKKKINADVKELLEKMLSHQISLSDTIDALKGIRASRSYINMVQNWYNTQANEKEVKDNEKQD